MIFVMWLSTRGCCPETVPSQQGLSQQVVIPNIGVECEKVLYCLRSVILILLNNIKLTFNCYPGHLHKNVVCY